MGTGVELWDVEYIKEAGGMNLRITIDSPNGISLDDCERFHRAIDPLLDEADPIPGSYTLEVTSPGIERALRRGEHYERFIGSRAALKLYTKRPEFLSKKINVTLLAYNANNGSLSVKPDETESELTLDLKEIAAANLINS